MTRTDFQFFPTEYTNDPFVISRNPNVVSINSAIQIDLTGQVCSDSIGARFYSGFGGQVDFVRGAKRSEGGRSFIALPSTAKNGSISRIVTSLPEGAGVVTTRADVHYVATEYGVAYLHGKNIRERGWPSSRSRILDSATNCSRILKKSTTSISTKGPSRTTTASSRTISPTA